MPEPKNDRPRNARSIKSDVAIPRPDCSAEELTSRQSVPTIQFTGERGAKHFQVDIRGNPVQLTYSSLISLIELTIARANSETGYIPISRVAVRRLRKAIDAKDTSSLLETGCGEEYRLAISKQQLAVRVSLQPSFFELVALNVVSKEQAEKLARITQLKQPKRYAGETAMQRGRNRKDTER